MVVLELILATRNAHKLAEVGRMLAPAGIAVRPLPDGIVLPPEDGDTFEANAVPKALAAARATGRPAIGDDSGIEAAELGGRPGVCSARYAGPGASDLENLDKLVAEAPAGSGLRYVCVIAFADPVDERRSFTVEGRCDGVMSGQRRGSRGFGYDPVFVPEQEAGRGERARTMAELSDAEKDEISHRGRAVRLLVDELRAAGYLP